MPITLGGKTYSDDEVRQFYANGGNEVAFAQQNGLSEAETQSAMSQARGITASAPASQSFTGNQAVDHNKGVFSPTENRWISNDEIKNYFSSNPNASADQINAMGGQLGLSPYAINYAAWQGNGGGDPRYNQKFWNLSAQLAASQHTGSSGYGADLDAAHRTDSNPLTAGAGNVQYKMPNGSYHSVRVHNGRPDQTYEQVLQNLGGLVGAPQAPTIQGQSGQGIINSIAQLPQVSSDQSPPTVVADGGQYLPDGTWSDLVNGKHTGTISPGTYANSAIGSFRK